jgi:endonuclease YncB( thermonuclease family)
VHGPTGLLAIAISAAAVRGGVALAQTPVQLTCSGPHVADGDTITCDGVRVRIWGINAPELAHPDLGIIEEPGGQEAAERMYALTRTSVTCTEWGDGHDRYGRMVARCGTASTPDLGAEMIREGLACQWVRYSRHAYDGLGRDCSRRGK